MLVCRRVTPQQYVSATYLYTWVKRDSGVKVRVYSLKKQRDGRGLNHVHPDPEFDVLTARPHTSLDKNIRPLCLYINLLHVSYDWFLCLQIIIVQFFDTAFHVQDMDWDQWMWCLFLGFSELLWGQLIFTIPKNILPAAFRCVAVGVPQGRGIAYVRSCSRMEQQVWIQTLLRLR